MRSRAASHEAARILRPPARRRCAARAEGDVASGAGRSACGRRTRWSTPAPASFRRRRRTSTAATTRRARRRGAGGKSVVILGSGPNRIGQGVEFDYCCVRAVMALREQGYETIMINSNPGDGLDRLRHVGQAVLRAADARGRAGDRAARAADRRDRAARRSDAAASSTRGLEAAGVTHPRHVARRDRHGGGPAALRADRARARADAAAERHGDERRRGASRSRAHRLSGARAPVVRARRPRDADRVRRRRRCESTSRTAARVSRSGRC